MVARVRIRNLGQRLITLTVGMISLGFNGQLGSLDTDIEARRPDGFDIAARSPDALDIAARSPDALDIAVRKPTNSDIRYR